LSAIDEELRRVQNEAVTLEEIERARAKSELGLLASLETVDGKATTLGFYETVLGRPAAAFERLDAVRRVGPSDLLRAARRFFDERARSVVFVRKGLLDAEREAAE
jgi:zinc protease